MLDLGVPDRLLLFKTDAVVEGIHFTPDAAAGEDRPQGPGPLPERHRRHGGHAHGRAGHLGVAAELRARPVSRRSTPGMNALARRHSVAIVGGETTTNPERMLISIALLGTVPRGKARAALAARKRATRSLSPANWADRWPGKHLEFEPRLAEARWLAAHFPVHAMIDLSDGLAGDLRHMLQASGVGAELLAASIPISREARLAAKAGILRQAAAAGGADRRRGFRVLFTVASRDAVPLLDAWKQQFPKVRLTCIGKITAGEGITLRDKQGVRPLNAHGYVHFA